jgi:hypothetical protein
MTHEQVPEPAPVTQKSAEARPRHRTNGRTVLAATAMALAAVGGGLLLARGGESEHDPFAGPDTAAATLATEIAGLYLTDPGVTRDIEPAGDDGSEIFKARYQVPGPAEGDGRPADSTEYSLYVQVPDAETALRDGKIAADEIISVNVNAAHVLGSDYTGSAPFMASLSQSGGDWTVSVQGTDAGGRWRAFGTSDPAAMPDRAEMQGVIPLSPDQQSDVFRQMHDVVELARQGEPLPSAERP